jgi:dolichol-phosphate mannosyltransferase
VTVVVPTFRERENLPALIGGLKALRAQLDLGVLLVDDNSNDGTEELVRGYDLPWLDILVRRQDPGLSQSVMAGLHHANGQYLVVMDADLSHPPEAIPRLIEQLEAGARFALGSRYVRGASTDAAWGIGRYLNSKVATWLARPFTRATDPMAGFFAMRRSDFATAAPLNPVGYKIGLELIVKCGIHEVAEVPIHFADRTAGQSKLTLRQQLSYIQHLRRLFLYKYPNWAHVLQFCVVGASGLVVNLAVLTLLLLAGMPNALAVAGGIAVSLVSNFLLNRRFTFSHAKDGPILRQFAGFVSACAMGAAVNYVTTIALLALMPQLIPQVAATVGVAAGTALNFACNRFFVFRHAAT